MSLLECKVPWLLVAVGIKLFIEWFKSYHDNKIDDVGRQGKIELDTKLLNEEVDTKNKLFRERLTLLQNR